MTFSDRLMSANLMTKFFHYNALIVTNYCLSMMNTFVAKTTIYCNVR